MDGSSLNYLRKITVSRKPPAAPAGQNEDRWKFSTAEKGAEPAILGRARTEIEERRRLGNRERRRGGRYRLLVVASHPVQYMAPIFRRWRSIPDWICKWLIAASAARRRDTIQNREASEMGCAAAGRLCGTHVPNQKFGSGIFLGMNNPGLKRSLARGV